MTAVTLNEHTKTHPIQHGMSVLRFDAVFTEIIGLALLLGGQGLAESLGLLPMGLYTVLGVAMVVYGIGLWFATGRWMGARLLRLQMAANVVWIVASEALLLTGAIPFTGLGIGVLMVTNLIVMSLAILQWRAANRWS